MRYSMKRLTESEDAFELMRQHRPTDELAEWAKSNMPVSYTHLTLPTIYSV